MKQKNKLFLILLPLLSLQVFSGCNNNDLKEQNLENSKEDESLDATNNNSALQDDIALKTVDNQESHLAVDSGCTGCGRCIKIDPAHFDFNPSTGKAIAASQDNLDSQNLEQAIKICPTNSISI